MNKHILFWIVLESWKQNENLDPKVWQGINSSGVASSILYCAWAGWKKFHGRHWLWTWNCMHTKLHSVACQAREEATNTCWPGFILWLKRLFLSSWYCTFWASSPAKQLCNIRSLNFHSLSHSRLGKEDYFEDPAVQCSSKKKKDSKRDYVLIRGLLAVEQWNRCWLTINTRIQ